MKRYRPSDIEPKWQKAWDENKTYRADLNSKKPKYIAMSMFNYPSGAGIHIGHAMNYTISDVLARFKRQQGFESYHPVGWDAFGLPAENYAIKAGVSPQKSMSMIIPNYHKQYKAMGWSNDWSKEISTHEPSYYKWTQWIFSEMFRAGLAYQDSRMQWFCEKCQTVLANEQVIDGKCWRHDGADDPEVTQREVKQWFFKVTEYADELLDAIDDLDWSEVVKIAQKNWIGRSKGAEIDFQVEGSKENIKVFTTRPDTLFGATFLVIAPEHEILNMLSISENKADVEKYIKDSAKKTDLERQTSKEKTGVFTGLYAVNPINDEKIPIWVADYVLAGYGTGAIMAVPAHDERDFEFAKKFDLPSRQVVAERFVDPSSPYREDKELVPRNVVTCIVKHPSDDKYIIARPIKGDNWSPLMGGIDEGESPEEAAARELLEETGYFDIKSKETKGNIFSSEFFAMHKDVNRIAYCQVVYIELASLKVNEELAVEKDDQEIKWVTEAEYRSLPTTGGMLEVFETAHGRHTDMVFEGRLINSGSYTGLTTDDAREKVVTDLEKKKQAEEKTIFKIRDWSVTRQRYWGAPAPIIRCPKCGPVLVPDEDLPVILPELKDFAPSGDGRSALGRADKSWLNAKCPKCDEMGERETDTLDTYICSSWYMLRYFDPKNDKQIFDSNIVNKWMPIDFYNGADHATAHMIYARFVTRFFHKRGLLDNPEPFKKFLFNGKVTASDGTMFSKSKGNGVDPLEIINDGYGADALRTYLMFAAPLEIGARWDPQGVPGAYRFINRVWNIVQEFLESLEKSEGKSDSVLKAVHPAIKKVTSDIEDQKYNTAIAALMKCTNDLYEIKAKDGFVGRKDWLFALESMVMLMAPFAPHAAEELWDNLGHKDSVHVDHWPKWDEKYLVNDIMTIVVQVNGKVRAELEVSSDASEEDIKAEAVKNDKVQKYLDGKEPKKIVYVPGRLLSLVI